VEEAGALSVILFEDSKQRVEARKGLVTILDKTNDVTRIVDHDESERWLDHWTRNLPGPGGVDQGQHTQGADDEPRGA
jgi:hypothetical protein